MGHYTHLSMRERLRIKAFLDMGVSISHIAQRLKRHRSTIYREIERNTDNDGCYRAGPAQDLYLLRQVRRPHKLFPGTPLYQYVITKLKSGWSPEQIAGRMHQQKLPYQVCFETIYRYVYRNPGRGLYRYLPHQRPKRKGRGVRRSRRDFGLRDINNRPAEIETRKRLGHWEGDTIRFQGERKRSVTTLVERKSRFLIMLDNIRSYSNDVMGKIGGALRHMPAKLRRTVTFDQGNEFMIFELIECLEKCKVYYCKARSPWQRGSNENTNRRIRRFLPKNTDISQLSQEMLDVIATVMNSTPRKCLGFMTPKEVFSKG